MTIAAIIACPDPAKADVVLLGAPYDRTVSFGAGASGGPAAIVECLKFQIETYDRLSESSPAKHLAIAYHGLDELSAAAPEEMVARLSAAYQRFAGKFRLLLGGEHSVSNGALRCLAPRSREITVVQIDAHADLRMDDSDYADTPHGPYAHCAVMRRAHELGFPLVQVGIRAYCQDEQLLFNTPGITTFEWDATPPAISTILAAIKTKDVYLTIDADGLDPAVMPATGTPVPGGLGWYECLELLRELFARHQVIGADLVEVAPRPGDQLTEYTAAQLCYSLIGLHYRTR